MGKRIVAVIGAALAVLAVVAGGEVDAAGTPPPGTIDPLAAPGALLLEGELVVNGRRVEASVERTDRMPAEVIAAARASWAQAPVDLFERALPDGAMLSILDVAAGRQIVVAARRRDGRTEVLRGWSPLVGAAPRSDLPFLLPDGWLVAASVEDRLAGRRVGSWTVLAPLDAAAAARALEVQLRGAGWEPRDGGWRRGGAALQIDFHGEGAQTAMQLRLEEGAR